MADQNTADRAAITKASQQMSAAIEGDDVEGILETAEDLVHIYL